MSDGGDTPENLTAYQRWELPAFADGRALARSVGLPTAAELEQVQRQASEEGYAEGKQRGFAEGMQLAQQEVQRLAALTHLLEQQVDELVARELMGLSLDIARQILQQSLKVQPELLLAAVREAIATLPVFNQGAHLILHPADAELVRQQMGEQLTHSGWKILEDVRMERGGARLETGSSQVDASLEARWKRVLAAMGQDAPWLAQE